MKGRDNIMAKMALVRLECNVPNPNNPCSHSFSCAAAVEGVCADSVPEAVEMVCDAMRRQLISDEVVDTGIPGQNPQCDGKGGCGGVCHQQCRSAGLTAEQPRGATAPDYPEATDPAGDDGDDSTAFFEGEPDDCDRSEFGARQFIPQRQYVSIDLPSGGHVVMPDNFVFFGPARLFEEMF